MDADRPVDDERSKFAQLLDDNVIKRLLLSIGPGSRIDMDKYGDEWLKLHKIAVSIDELLVYFPDSHSATFNRSLGRSQLKQMKNERKWLVTPLP